MFRKEVHRRSLLRNLYRKTPSLENERPYKKKKNKGINVCFCEKNVLKNTFKKLQKMVLS